MINAIIRIKKYQETIQKTVTDKLFIDIGAGTGVLSMILAQNDAQNVFAIEFSYIKNLLLMKLKKIISYKITVILERAETVELPVKQVEIIKSEWMGYFLLKENMLPSAQQIRKKYLRENGILIPKKDLDYIQLDFLKNRQLMEQIQNYLKNKSIILLKLKFVKNQLFQQISLQYFL